MKSNPALPGGSLTSKPTWSNAFGCSATSAFFVLVGRRGPDERFFRRKVERHVNNPMAAFWRGVAGDEPAAGGNGAVVAPCWDERPAAVCPQRLSAAQSLGGRKQPVRGSGTSRSGADRPGNLRQRRQSAVDQRRAQATRAGTRYVAPPGARPRQLLPDRASCRSTWTATRSRPNSSTVC